MLSWIRNLLGIRKDIIDTDKAKIETLKAELEVDKLEDEASERNLITRVTMQDIEKYDQKTQRLIKKIFKDGWRPQYRGASLKEILKIELESERKLRHYRRHRIISITLLISFLTLSAFLVIYILIYALTR